MASRLNWNSKLGPSSINPHSALDGMDEIQREMGLTSVSEEEGGFTVEDYAKRYQIPRATAYGQIKRMITAGKVELLGRRAKQSVYRIVNVKKSH